MWLNDDFGNFHRFHAEKIQTVLRRILSERELLAGKMQIEARIDHVIRGMVIELTSYMIGEHRDTVSIHKRWPRNWWQAFREEWFPSWWLRRWPVQYERIDVEQKVYGPVCPHLNISDRSAHRHWTTLANKIGE